MDGSDLVYLLGNFLGAAIPGAILLAILYGIFVLIRRGYRSALSNLTKDNAEVNGKKRLTYEQKKSFLDIVKLLVGAQLVGLLFYITPVINENIKIIASLLITIGSFAGTFFIKEKRGYNGFCRTLIFIGQEFFGMTMFLMMVNKGMGYSINAIFAIWTVFNFYISKQFGKIENKIFFWLTFIILTFSMIGAYSNVAQLHILVIGICIVLLAIHFFGNNSKISTKLLTNVFLTILLGILMGTMSNSSASKELINGSIAIYMITIVVTLVVTGRFNPKALFVYLPYVVSLFISNLEIGFIDMLSVFNILFVIELLSDKSIYRKILCALGLIFVVIPVVSNTSIDQLLALIIYSSAVIISFTYLFAPARPDNLKEGEEENEE